MTAQTMSRKYMKIIFDSMSLKKYIWMVGMKNFCQNLMITTTKKSDR